MPRKKQPVPLQELAFDFLIRNTVQHCDALSMKGDLIELSRSIAVIKQHLNKHMPGILFAEFCMQFFDRFYSIGASRSRSDKRLASHQKAALEMVMDVDIVGLTCAGDMMRYLDPGDVHRLQGLRVLDWTDSSNVPKCLENYRLQDLTTFIIPRICTDLDLEVIGQRCLKLEVLKLPRSKKVTDKGLRALRPCSKLRIIDLHFCLVSDDGVNELLDFHKKLEEFNVGDYFTSGEKSFDVLSRPISLVCPSVKRFALKPDHVTNTHLRSVMALFPNLTYLKFCCPFTGDLRILKDLKSLRELELGLYSGVFSMENLKELLTSIGENISRLYLESNVCVTQNDLNYIFRVCGNVERLNICYIPIRPKDKLIIPPFQKLKHFSCVAYAGCTGFHVELEFGEMPSLEILGVRGFYPILEMTELMMLDNKNFPNLREVRMYHTQNREVVDRIRQIARSKNLDFSIIEE